MVLRPNSTFSRVVATAKFTAMSPPLAVQPGREGDHRPPPGSSYPYLSDLTASHRGAVPEARFGAFPQLNTRSVGPDRPGRSRPVSTVVGPGSAPAGSVSYPFDNGR